MKRAPLLLVALAVAACGTEQSTQPDVDPLFEIRDAAHNGNAGFYWLPPMVPQPNPTGTFAGTLKPTVVICGIPNPDAAPPLCQGPEATWTFTRTSGPGDERVTVDVHGQHYQVNWHTHDFKHPGYEWYRVSVWLGGRELGFADVFIDENANTFRHLEQTIGLIDGSTLPIKFRIEDEMFDDAILDVMFHSDAGGDLDVFLMDSRTGVTRNITADPALDGTANWSPDGSRIIFASDRANPGQGIDIYTMDPDGTNVLLLASDGWQPEYSPDGSMIAFQRGWPPEPCWGDPTCEGDGDPNDPTGRQHDIWVMDANGGNQIQLTDVRPPGELDLYEDFSPTWHPTQPWVTFGRYRNSIGDQTEACPAQRPADDWWADPRHYCAFDVVSVKVSDPGNLLWIRHTYFTQLDLLGPRWSPGGSELTVKRNANDGWVIVFLPPPPTSLATFPGVAKNLTEILNPGDPPWERQGTEDGNLAWSPDGTKVLFTSQRSGDSGIYFVDNWNAWRDAGSSYPQLPFLVVPGLQFDWARFRPN